ncbi:hypothetical protein U9M48_042115 [Paspalum notatum var. saurae]|uniref:DUF659 domain-containing protein n=1 Tax=Paspalum notatum var. saurae TaxID=547442 RepID=A0AAQ3UUN0_PASNO
MVTAIKNAPKDYKGPNSEKARTTLLDACKRSVENDLGALKSTWLTQGVSVVSDGWSDIKNKQLINVTASNSRGSCFLYAEDFSGVGKTGVAIAEFLLKAIDEIGPGNVLQVVTDNASNCKAAGKEIEKVHKHIIWAPCVVHTLNLIFKDFAAKFPWMLETYRTGKAIVKFFQGHSRCLAMFRTNSRLDLLKVKKTRFASHYILLQRLITCREALATTVVTRQWKDWVSTSSSDLKQQARAIAQTINDDDFWSEVENIIAITGPIYSVLRFSDGEGSKMGEIYERMDCMVGQIKDIVTKEDNPHKEDFAEVQSIVIGRWERMNLPLHCLAYALCPKFYHQQYLNTPAPGGNTREAPNIDVEVMTNVLAAFEKIADSPSENKVFREQFNIFIMKKGMFAVPEVQSDAYSMNAIDWWTSYGSVTPELAEVAKRLISRRIWSTYQYIHSAKRNKLNPGTADKLVFIHSNLRLISRSTESYKGGAHSKWDVDPEDPAI